MGIFRAGVEPGNPAALLPEFNVVAIDKLLGGFDCRVIARAIELDRINEMAVAANDVDAITNHALTGGIRPMDAETGALIPHPKTGAFQCLPGFRLMPREIQIRPLRLKTGQYRVVKRNTCAAIRSAFVSA